MSFPTSSTAATVVAHRVAKSRGARPVLVDVDLVVGPDSRLGVVEIGRAHV